MAVQRRVGSGSVYRTRSVGDDGSHTVRSAGMLTLDDFLVGYERFEVLDAVGGEDHSAVFVL